MRLKFDYVFENVVVEDTSKPLIVIPANSFISYNVKISSEITFDLTLYFYSENLKLIKTRGIPFVNECEINDETYGFAHYIIVMPKTKTSYKIIITTETVYPV